MSLAQELRAFEILHVQYLSWYQNGSDSVSLFNYAVLKFFVSVNRVTVLCPCWFFSLLTVILCVKELTSVVPVSHPFVPSLMLVVLCVIVKFRYVNLHCIIISFN